MLALVVLMALPLCLYAAQASAQCFSVNWYGKVTWWLRLRDIVVHVAYLALYAYLWSNSHAAKRDLALGLSCLLLVTHLISRMGSHVKYARARAVLTIHMAIMVYGAGFVLYTT